MNTVKVFYCVISTLLLIGSVNYPAISAEHEKQQEILMLVEELTNSHGFDRNSLSTVLKSAKIKKSILKAIDSPSEAKPWYQYRKIFLSSSRIQKGLNFWKKNKSLLIAIENQYGVPPEIIVAIIGVETFYGGYTGSYRVLDALFTLAFEYPKRSRFFRNELKEFLLLCREEDIDPATPKGSYAGAMGLPQFMPSSFRSFATDSDGDNRRDIWNNHADTIASVANYFAKHGWQPGEPVIFPAKVNGTQFESALGKGLEPNHTVERLDQLGVHIAESIDPGAMARLLKLEESNGPSFWLGMKNFYVITRYNHSALYAMAVYQLSQAILLEQNRNKKPA